MCQVDLVKDIEVKPWRRDPKASFTAATWSGDSNAAGCQLLSYKTKVWKKVKAPCKNRFEKFWTLQSSEFRKTSQRLEHITVCRHVTRQNLLCSIFPNPKTMQAILQGWFTQLVFLRAGFEKHRPTSIMGYIQPEVILQPCALVIVKAGWGCRIRTEVHLKYENSSVFIVTSTLWEGSFFSTLLMSGFPI